MDSDQPSFPSELWLISATVIDQYDDDPGLVGDLSLFGITVLPPHIEHDQGSDPNP